MGIAQIALRPLNVCQTGTVVHFFWTLFLSTAFWHCQNELKSAQTILASVLTPPKTKNWPLINCTNVSILWVTMIVSTFFLPRPEKIIIFAMTRKNTHLPAPSASCYVVLQQVLPHVGILFLQTGTKLHHNWHWHSSATHRSTMQPDIWTGPGINVWGGSWDIDKHTGLRLAA